jgi:hypothetical protein
MSSHACSKGTVHKEHCQRGGAYVHVHARTVHVMHMNEHACSKGTVHEEHCQQGSAYVHVVMHMNVSASEARRCGAKDVQGEAERARRLV